MKSVPALERQVIAAINDVRCVHGLEPLRLNRELAGVARAHSFSMAMEGYFAHSSASGLPFWRRIEARYGIGGGRQWSVGENLAWASPSLSAGRAIELWLNSPLHRRNLLGPAWRDVGVGGVDARPAPGVYEGLAVMIVTVDFGVRR